MASDGFDFAVFGGGILAQLLAGLLAERHRKRVCLIGEGYSPFRLARTFGLAAAAITRPETWALLRLCEPESLRLMTEIGGRHALRRIDAHFIGENAETAAGLQHALHMARAFGVEADRVEAGRNSPPIYRFRKIAAINTAVLEPALAAWLMRSGIPMLAPHEINLARKRDGSVTIKTDARSLDAAHVVLADDQAIAAHETAPTLRQVPGTALLVRTSKHLSAPYVHYLDRRLELRQQENGVIAAIVSDAPRQADRLLTAGLGSPLFSKTGEAHFVQLLAGDGAPAIGMAPGSKTLIVGGLGPYGPFLAPALARFIAGSATDAENVYFAGHRPRKIVRRAVAEFAVQRETMPP